MNENSKKYNAIKLDKVKVQGTSKKIHDWLTANRAGYNAVLWSEPIENHSKKGEFTISLPPEVNNILTAEERVGLIQGDLPPDWFPPLPNTLN